MSTSLLSTVCGLFNIFILFLPYGPVSVRRDGAQVLPSCTDDIVPWEHIRRDNMDNRGHVTLGDTVHVDTDSSDQCASLKCKTMNRPH